MNQLDQAASLRQTRAQTTSLQGKSRVRCLAVSSGKGGVGKTFISVNLALSLKKQGKRVLIVDADLGLANADIVLGMTPEYTMQDAIFHGRPLREVICHAPYGVDLVAASAGSKEMVTLGDARLQNMLQDLLTLASDYDFILFDCASGIAPSVLCFIGAATQNLIVATGDPTSMMDVYALIKVIQQRQLASQVDLVVNRAKSMDDGKRIYQTLSKVCSQFLSFKMSLVGVIPDTPKATKALASCRPLVEVCPDDLATKQLADLARRIIRRDAGSEIFDESSVNAIVNGILSVGEPRAALRPDARPFDEPMEETTTSNRE